MHWNWSSRTTLALSGPHWLTTTLSDGPCRSVQYTVHSTQYSPSLWCQSRCVNSYNWIQSIYMRAGRPVRLWLGNDSTQTDHWRIVIIPGHQYQHWLHPGLAASTLAGLWMDSEWTLAGLAGLWVHPGFTTVLCQLVWIWIYNSLKTVWKHESSQPDIYRAELYSIRN